MNSKVRNSLAELLLDSFKDPEKRAVIRWLDEYCKLALGRGEVRVPLNSLPATVSEMGGSIARAPGRLAGMEKLFRLRRAEGGASWSVEPLPDVRTDFSAVCERVRIYVGLVGRMGECEAGLCEGDPLVRAMADAALCFDAGLFFETHEHLEHHWAAVPKGPTKWFLQGIIQISVGFHHPCAGKYDGAVNQLGKGLEKTSGMGSEFLGLACAAFLPKVAAVRDAIVKRGRANMRALTPQEIPHMPIRR
jgi:hypothetical protein